jgi:hypothetical protein
LPCLDISAKKTRQRLVSRRTLTLLPNVIDVLKTLLPLRVSPDSYVFTDANGKPIDQSEFARGVQGVLRVLKLRPRPFYNTRHTFISVAPTLGCNPKWIAEQTGTSLIMIQQNYGKYIRDDGDALLRAYVETPERDVVEPETETLSDEGVLRSRDYWRPRRDLNPCCRRERPVSWARLDDGDAVVSRAGFEPATLCLKGRCSTA